MVPESPQGYMELKVTIPITVAWEIQFDSPVVCRALPRAQLAKPHHGLLCERSHTSEPVQFFLEGTHSSSYWDNIISQWQHSVNFTTSTKTDSPVSHVCHLRTTGYLCFAFSLECPLVQLAGAKQAVYALDKQTNKKPNHHAHRW